MQLFDIKKQTAGLQLTYTVKPEDTVDTVGLGMCTHQQMPSGLAPLLFTQTDNEKYAMRCWRLRLGFIGDEFATAREILLRNMEGNASWRNK